MNACEILNSNFAEFFRLALKLSTQDALYTHTYHAKVTSTLVDWRYPMNSISRVALGCLGRLGNAMIPGQGSSSFIDFRSIQVTHR